MSDETEIASGWTARQLALFVLAFLVVVPSLAGIATAFYYLGGSLIAHPERLGSALQFGVMGAYLFGWPSIVASAVALALVAMVFRRVGPVASALTVGIVSFIAFVAVMMQRQAPLVRDLEMAAVASVSAALFTGLLWLALRRAGLFGEGAA